jgi:hypothetical protein
MIERHKQYFKCFAHGMIYKGIGLRVYILRSKESVSQSIGHGMVLKDFWGDGNRQGCPAGSASCLPFYYRNTLSQMSVWCRTFLQLTE